MATTIATTTATTQAVSDHALPREPDVTRLYRHDCKYECCPSRWSKYDTVSDEQLSLESKILSDPIVHRHHFDDDKKWVTASFTINSRVMRSILSEALDGYQDLDMGLLNWTFFPPYIPLVHRWDKLLILHLRLAVKKDLGLSPEEREMKLTAIGQLMSFLKLLLTPSVSAFAETRRTGKIAFDIVWQIFPPGELVVTDFLKKTPRGEPAYWVIILEYVDWNGERCGLTETKSLIYEFEGFQRVLSLPVYPVSFVEDPAGWKERATERGRKFEQLRGYHFLSYNGTKVLMGEQAEERPISSRVMVDAYAYYRSSNIVKPTLRSLDSAEDKNTEKKNPHNNSDGSGNDSDDGSSSSEDYIPLRITKPAAAGRIEDMTPLSDGDCLLCIPWVIGLDLKSKQWGRFLIDNLEDIAWNDNAFSNLVLPGGEKELAWDFVESKASSRGEIDDFVPDKGRGIIILMFGPPGVGKTYTAEAVSERARVPLYSISAGALGVNPKDVEAALSYILELCSMWNAMLLLDEADIFLSARSDVGFARNELVSIFLTKLEYYQGILFLTTNRFSSIDHAFQSRVDLFLPYSALTSTARRQVWENFIDHLGQARFQVSSTDLDELSELDLNGREIKNLIKTAQLLSFKSKGIVTADRLRMLAEKRVQALEMLKD